MQNYLIVTNNYPPFTSDYFDAENNFDASIDMVVINLHQLTYTRDGEQWKPLEEDHL